MKRIFYYPIVSLALILTAGCSKPQSQAAPGEGTDADKGVRSLKVTLPFDEEDYAWSASERVGVYGSRQGENECYVPLNASTTLYGPSVRGDIFVYWPYASRPSEALSEGMAPLAGVQTHDTELIRLLRDNTVAVGWLGSDATVELEFLAGVLELSLPVEIDGLVSKLELSSFGHNLCGFLYEEDGTVKVSRGVRALTVRSIGRPCKKTAPLKVYAVLPEGVYEDLQVSIWSDKGAVVSKPLAGSCTLRRGQLSRGVIDEDKILDFANGDLTYEEGSYDD